MKKPARFLRYIFPVLSFLVVSACSPSIEKLKAVEYAPLPDSPWEVASPEEVSLDSLSVARLYYNAEQNETLLGLLVIKDGYLVAEKYFHEGSVDQKARLQSVTKSFTSALTGIAIDKGYLENTDQKVIEYFPELADRIKDSRKKEITIQQMLQMRAGYPWEESSDELFAMLYRGFRPELLVEVPLVSDPGTHMEYSNLTAHLLGITVARATDMDLEAFADEYLFAPLDIERGEWIKDWEGYNNAHADLHLRLRDIAKLGLLYLNEGTYDGEQILPEKWVSASLKVYSEDAWNHRVGRNFKDIGYGYLWWSVRAGDHRYNLAWGHGGQQIAVLEDMNMVIAATCDPLVGEHGGGPWRHERACLNLVADFIATLPAGE